MEPLDYIYTSRYPYPAHRNGGKMAFSFVVETMRVLRYSLSYKGHYDKKKKVQVYSSEKGNILD